MTYSKESSRTEQDLKFRKAQDRLWSTLRMKSPKPTRIAGTPKRTADENAAIVRDLEEKIKTGWLNGNIYRN
jgi:hypothetical protein